MKKTRLFAALLATAMTAALLCVAFLAPMRTSAASADVRHETFNLLAIDEKAPEDDAWYKDGVVVLVNNPSDAEVKLASGDYKLRYLYILVFDSNGICVEIGNNLFAADDKDAAKYPQHDVSVPAGGFAIFYYYNPDATANAALNDFYTDLGGATLYNSTMKVSGKKYSAVIENKTVTIYFGEVSDTGDTGNTGDTGDTGNTGDDKGDTGDDKGDDKGDTDTNSPSATTPSASTPSSSAGPAAGDAGLLGFAVLAVVAISGLAVAVKVRK